MASKEGEFAVIDIQPTTQSTNGGQTQPSTSNQVVKKEEVRETAKGDLDNPKLPTNVVIFNQNFRTRFMKMSTTIEKLTKDNVLATPTEQSKFDSIDDVDFVLIVEKNSSNFNRKAANRMAKIRGRKPITDEILTKARQDYLDYLVAKFKIRYHKLEAKERDYYLIQLSFEHLGLMMELMAYQWPLKTSIPNAKAYKTFFFMKRDEPRYHNYDLYENARKSFGARWRYDLAYYFLIGATVPMPYVNPWRNALKEPYEEQCEQFETKKKEHDAKVKETLEQPISAEQGLTAPPRVKGYTLMRLFNDGLFDDWMVLHDPMHKIDKQEVNKTYKDVEKGNGHCCSAFSACMFTSCTCQREEAKSENLSIDYEKEKTCCRYTSTFCSAWRRTFFNNFINANNLQPKKLEKEQRVES